MSVGVYLNFHGNCREAIEFYTDVFKAETVQVMTYGDMPGGAGNLPEDMKKRILYASLNMAGGNIMMSDAMYGTQVINGDNVNVIVMLPMAWQIKDIYEKLTAGGKIVMALQETFFSKSYGIVEDKFGVVWQLFLENGTDTAGSKEGMSGVDTMGGM